MPTRTLVHGQAAPGAPERLIKGVVFAVLSLAVIIPFLTVFSTSVAPREQISDAGGLVLFPAPSTSRPTKRSSAAGSSPGRSPSASS